MLHLDVVELILSVIWKVLCCMMHIPTLYPGGIKRSFSFCVSNHTLPRQKCMCVFSIYRKVNPVHREC